MTRPPRIYFDASALNRPFDDQTIARNRVEAEAVVALLEAVEKGRAALVGSEVLEYENRRNPLARRREQVGACLSLARVFVRADVELRNRARQIEKRGVVGLDALHIAAAERARAIWFVTCDDRVLRRARRGRLGVKVWVVSPADLTREGGLFDG